MFKKFLDASCSQDMSDKNVILVLKYCIFDRTIFGAIKCMVAYALSNGFIHFTSYT